MLPPSPFTLPDSGAGFHIEGRGRPIVLLHGAMDPKGPWPRLVERLRHSHRLIAIDLQGEGSTPDTVDAFAQQRQLARVESVLRMGLLPRERFHLVGHAHGAVLAFRIARSRPQRLHSLSMFERDAVPDGGHRITVPMCWLSDRGGPQTAHELEGFICGVDAFTPPLRGRVALHG